MSPLALDVLEGLATMTLLGRMVESEAEPGWRRGLASVGMTKVVEGLEQVIDALDDGDRDGETKLLEMAERAGDQDTIAILTRMKERRARRRIECHADDFSFWGPGGR